MTHRAPIPLPGALAVLAAMAAMVLGWAGPAGARAEARGHVPSPTVPVADGVVVDQGPPLVRGDRGESVADWQRRLDDWLGLTGAPPGPLDADGIFGPVTEAATLEFQRRHPALVADAVVDAIDRVALREAVDQLLAGEPLPIGRFTAGPVTSAAHPSPGRPASLVGVRTSSHVGFDRVVFEFAAPGQIEYRVGHVEGPVVGPAGGAIDVTGEALVEIEISGASAPATGPGSAPAVEPAIDGLQVVDDLVPVEATGERLRWVLGTRRHTALAVEPLDDPLRLVVDVATPTTAVLLGPMSPCRNPHGFALAHPRSWSTNPGDVGPPCSRFHPEPLHAPGDGQRVAAITARVSDRPFAELIAPDPARQEERVEVTIDGLRAVRLEHDSREVGSWPAGTPVTMYLIDLSEVAGEPRTLIIDTAGVGAFDYAHHRAVLDRIARTLEVDRDEADPSLDETAAGPARG